MADRNTAVTFFNQAVKALGDQTNPSNKQLAYQLFSSACHADPTWWEAWYQAGCNNNDIADGQKNYTIFKAAVANWQRALPLAENDDQRIRTLVNIGWRQNSLGLVTEARDSTQAALKLNRNNSHAWLNLSLIYQKLNEPELMMEAAKRCYELEPANANCEIALAFAHLFNRNWELGLKHFESRFEWRLRSFLQFPYEKWNGQEGKTLFLAADQGLGDTLSYARFVEQAAKRCKYVHAYIQPELYRLFSHAFMHLSNINLIPAPAPFPQADYWTTFVSLPYALGLNDSDIEWRPHIECPSLGMPANWKNPDAKFHVGIAWKGSPLNDIDRYRNIPVEEFVPLSTIPGVQLYGMQVGEATNDMDVVGGGALVRNIAPYIREVTDTLALLRELDLVISVESALPHICALADKECWIPYSWQGKDYRLGLKGEQPLWAPKHRAFCQQMGEDWAPVFAQIAAELRERVT